MSANTRPHPRRRHALSALAAGAAAPLLLLPSTLRAAPAQAGQTVAWPEVTLLDGTRWGAKQAQGKAVVVVFWSTTCPFCLRHNAHVSKLQQQLQREGAASTLEILTVARERDGSVVQRYLDKNGYRFAVTLDHAPLSAALSTRRMIPLTVTVGRDGRLRQVIPGEMFEDDVLDLPRALA
jgi:thiol-disulfide isomerase/thioredoxin